VSFPIRPGSDSCRWRLNRVDSRVECTGAGALWRFPADSRWRPRWPWLTADWVGGDRSVDLGAFRTKPWRAGEKVDPQAVLSAPRPPERADSEVDEDHRRAELKTAPNPLQSGPILPKAQSEDHCEQQKKCARHLKPQDAAHAAEGAQKASDAAADTSSGLGRGLSGCLPGGAVLNLGAGVQLDGLGWGRASPGLCLGGQPLSHNAARDAHSNAHSPADDSRFHTVYDGSSGSWRIAPPAAAPGLLLNGNGSNVKRILAATRASSTRGQLVPEFWR